MGFIAKLESSMDWSLHRSRIAISLSDEYPRDYSIEDAIADYTRINIATTHAQTLVYENYLRYIRELSVSVDNSCLGFIRDCGNVIDEMFNDYRNEYRARLSLKNIILIIMLAKIYGCNDASEIADFYNEHYLELFILLPRLPKFTRGISSCTFAVALRMLNATELKKFFEQYFAKIKILIDAQIQYNSEVYRERDQEVLDTVAFDGQELKSTFRRGESSRRRKGGIITQLFNSTQRVALGFEISELKNHEKDDVLSIMERVDLSGTVVMCDALNSQRAVSEQATASHAYYMLPLANNGNKELRIHVEAIFNRNHKKTEKVHTQTAKPTHGRQECLDVEVLPAAPYLDERIHNQHQNVQVLVKKSKTTDYIIDGEVIKQTSDTTYYVASFPYAKGYSLKQAQACIEDYWQIETNHSFLDNPLFLDQDNLQACSPETISNTAAFNKLACNVVAVIRQELSRKKGKSVPISFKRVERMINNMLVAEVIEYLYDYFLQDNA